MRERIVLFFGSDCENEGFDFYRPKYRKSRSDQSDFRLADQNSSNSQTHDKRKHGIQ
jgi:hypothetical protein